MEIGNRGSCIDIKLFQPLVMKQSLLPDNANCLTVQAFLKMCGLQFTVEERWNAEFMSPSQHVPFLKCGDFVLDDLDAIVSFVRSKSPNLSNNLTATEISNMRAYISLINNALGNAELYITWCELKVFNEVTKPRYGSVFPWPLRHFLCWQKRKQILNKLKIVGWAEKCFEDVCDEVEFCCNALSEQLGGKHFFFGDRPTEIDGLIFGHLFTMLTTPLPNTQLAAIIKKFSNLVDLCKSIEKMYFAHEAQEPIK